MTALRKKYKDATESEKFMHDQLLEAKKVNRALMFELEQHKKTSGSLKPVSEDPKDIETKVPGKEQDPDLHHFSELLL